MRRRSRKSGCPTATGSFPIHAPTWARKPKSLTERQKHKRNKRVLVSIGSCARKTRNSGRSPASTTNTWQNVTKTSTTVFRIDFARNRLGSHQRIAAIIMDGSKFAMRKRNVYSTLGVCLIALQLSQTLPSSLSRLRYQGFLNAVAFASDLVGLSTTRKVAENILLWIFLSSFLMT